MPLDIGLARQMATQPYPSIRLSLDDDGYYWFCYDDFEELAKQTGQMIDLYDGAWFHGPHLQELMRTLRRIAERARQMPEQWDQCVGYSFGSNVAPTAPTPIHMPVHRDVLFSLLSAFEELVDEAIRGDLWVACLGD